MGTAETPRHGPSGGGFSAVSSQPLELAWFAALCDDDYELLGAPESLRPSSVAHCQEIVTEAEVQGFDAILLPSGYELGIDAISFAATLGFLTTSIRPLVAIRCGELWPPQLARQLASLDEILGGRLLVNIISSDLPGETLSGADRYGRSLEVMQSLRGLFAQSEIAHHGPAYQFRVKSPRIVRERNVCPALYFGGLSEEARELAAQEADVYLMWPDTEEKVIDIVEDIKRRSALHGRSIRFGYRVHVIVRETEEEARDAATRLISAVSDEAGAAIQARSLDATSVGVNRQGELHAEADNDGYVEPNLWTGIGRARSGCGAAIVGNPQQVAAKIERYREIGIDSFIFSGYPHREECQRFGELVMPLLRR